MKKRSPQPPREFSYSGNFQDNPLPELLHKIAQYKVPGVITVTHKQLSKQIYIKDVQIIFASSNCQEDHLGEFLFRCGKISRKDLDHSIEQLLRRKGRRQGEILIELKALPQPELAWAVRSHQQAIIWSLFDWFEGELTFNIGTYKEEEPIKLDLSIPRAILDGVRNIHQAKRVIAYMGSRNTVFEPEEGSLLSIEGYGADEKERDILKRVDGKTILYDLCDQSPYGAHETAKILYGLYILKLVRKKSEGIRIVSSLSSSNF